MKTIKRVSIFCLMSLVLVLGITSIFPSDIKLVQALSSSAKAMCVLEKNSKRVIYSKNMEEKYASQCRSKRHRI